MDMKPEYLSIIALIISLLSLGLSAYIGLRDRSKLKTSSNKLDTQPPQIEIKAVNQGRRSLVLYSIGATYNNGNFWKKIFESYEMHMDGNQKIEKQEHGIRLIENDYYREVISPDDDFFNWESKDDSFPISIWFEDSVGKRYKIPDIGKHLSQLNKYNKSS